MPASCTRRHVLSTMWPGEELAGGVQIEPSGRGLPFGPLHSGWTSRPVQRMPLVTGSSRHLASANGSSGVHAVPAGTGCLATSRHSGKMRRPRHLRLWLPPRPVTSVQCCCTWSGAAVLQGAPTVFGWPWSKQLRSGTRIPRHRRFIEFELELKLEGCSEVEPDPNWAAHDTFQGGSGTGVKG